jgi:asparagine synthase (glutamine-hydrolysing)
MCGIFGVWHDASIQLDPETLAVAARVQAHRGPDSHGSEIFRFQGSTLVLAHQRLSIIDLTDAGHQPMAYRGNQGSLVYNGELYNYLELRAELAREGELFSTQTDTEVVLAALHHWGAERALQRFNWMGAFAWFDRSQERLVLACDAGSEKPLYYCVDGGALVFASEIKTLLTLLNRKFSLDRETVGQFVYQGLSDASTRTFFSGISRLAAGSYAELEIRSGRRQVVPKPYQPPRYAGSAANMPLPQFIDELRATFIDAVRVRLRSDVPVGVLLSGGVDSSSIAAIAHTLGGRDGPPQLLSAVSDDPHFDESTHIEAMERHLRQRAHKIALRATAKGFVAELSNANWYNDAPVAGVSALGHYRLMERAKQIGLTVILSGQGADEILLGYRKFLGFYIQSLLRRGRLIKAGTVLAGFIANRTIVNEFDFSDAKRYVPLLRQISRLVNRDRSEVPADGEWLEGWQPLPLGLGAGSLSDRQRLDVSNYSVPALCHYEDRMSMAMSREIRLPFLDSRLVDMAIQAPDDYKLRTGWTKYAFRKAMEPFLPPEICWRKDKKGFSNPEGEWLKRELRDAVLDAFAPDSLVCGKGIMSSRALLHKYERYCRQRVKAGNIWDREIFAPFSLELWMRRYQPWIA